MKLLGKTEPMGFICLLIHSFESIYQGLTLCPEMGEVLRIQ